MSGNKKCYREKSGKVGRIPHQLEWSGEVSPELKAKYPKGTSLAMITEKVLQEDGIVNGL